VDNKVDSDTGTISIWVSFPNPDLKLIPGGYVTVLISELLKKKEPAVKLSAIMTDIGGNFVYRLDKDNKVVRQPVELGGVVRNLNIIKKGLQPGDIVIISGTNKVRPGMRVKPVLSDQAEKAEKKTPQ
jgi:RND family efflux transporter MFP subunit